MITILGSLLGFLSSFFPELMKMFRAKQDQRHELAILDKQIEMQKSLGTMKLQEINAQADIEASKAAHTPEQLTGIHWVDALNGTVRPVIAYLFVLAYMMVKVAQYHMMADAPALPWNTADVTQGWAQIISTLWGEEDWGILSTVLAYFYGTRGISKMKAG